MQISSRGWPNSAIRNFTFDYIQTPNVEGYERNYRESPFATGSGKLSLQSLPTSTFVGASRIRGELLSQLVAA
jgi:hypothetical protein